jgi:hypothetical protein
MLVCRGQEEFLRSARSGNRRWYVFHAYRQA